MVTKPILNMLAKHYSVSKAMAQMAVFEGVKGILDPQAQYLQARQAHQARLSMAAQQAPDMPFERPEPKRKGPGII